MKCCHWNLKYLKSMSRVMRAWIWPPFIDKIITPTLSVKYFLASPVRRETSLVPRWTQNPLMKVCVLGSHFRTIPAVLPLGYTDYTLGVLHGWHTRSVDQTHLKCAEFNRSEQVMKHGTSFVCAAELICGYTRDVRELWTSRNSMQMSKALKLSSW